MFFFCFLYHSCQDNKEKEISYPLLKVSTEVTKTSFFDLFEDAELICLETVDSSLIKKVTKIESWDNSYYILDEELSSLFRFDETGKYKDRIAKVGNGPGEYLYIYDFYLNKEKQRVDMFSPLGEFFCYNLHTFAFEKKYSLPKPPKSCWYFTGWTNDRYIIWSLALYPEEYAVNVVIPEKDSVVASYHNNQNWVLQTYCYPFYQDSKDDPHYFKPFECEVYEFTERGVEIAYAWDFGKKGIDFTNYKFPNSPDENRNFKEFFDMFDTGEISEAPFCFEWNNQTDKYYFARLRFAHRVKKNLFYNKETKDYMLFEKTMEGVSFSDPIYFTDEYMLFAVEPDKVEMLIPVLSDTEKQKINKIEESDNPILVKCYFKK